MWKFNEDFELPNVERPNIFGLWSYFIRFSPLNCSKGPFQVPCTLFTFAVFLAMCLRVYWMFWQTNTSFLTYGWGESFSYAFLTLESLFLLLGIFQITRSDSIRRFEMSMGSLRAMRVTKFHSKYDTYKLLQFRFTVYIIIIGTAILGSAIYLLVNEKFIYGTTTHSNWYYIVDFVVSVLCFYVHRLYLPIHIVLNSALQREIDVFNVELTETLKDPKIENLRKFGNRHVTLQNFANYMASRMNLLVNYASFAILMVVLCSSYITTTLRDKTVLFYFLCNIALSISSIIIFLTLLRPLAFIQESLLNTSNILLSATSLHQTSEEHAISPEIYEICRMMINRSIHNRKPATVLFIFDVSRKNIERSLFVVTMIGIVMVVTYQFMEFSEQVGAALLSGAASTNNT